MMKKIWIVLFILAVVNQVQAADSFYTSVKTDDCLTVNSPEVDGVPYEIDYYVGQCPGLSGYQVFIQGGDIRYNLQLKYNGFDIELPVLSAFHDMGSDKIEWRFKREDGMVRMTGLIYRLNFQDFNEETGDFFTNTRLYVVRLAGKESCLIGEVNASDSMNAEARNIADDESLSCK